MRFPDDVADDVRLRLSRLEGQIRGIQRMLDEGKDCDDVVTQLAAAKAALDRVSYRLMAAGMRHCVVTSDETAAEADDRMDIDALEKLFLKLS
jgi:CsoR family transcriptional regulator, copper-sensing transcriptional repressor